MDFERGFSIAFIIAAIGGVLFFLGGLALVGLVAWALLRFLGVA